MWLRNERKVKKAVRYQNIFFTKFLNQIEKKRVKIPIVILFFYYEIVHELQFTSIYLNMKQCNLRVWHTLCWTTRLTAFFTQHSFCFFSICVVVGRDRRLFRFFILRVIFVMLLLVIFFASVFYHKVHLLVN